MAIVDYDPAEGSAHQGDVNIYPLPEKYKLDRTQEIKAVNGRLVIVAGEATGHHHSIWFHPPMFRDDAIAHAFEAQYKARAAKAYLYQDERLVNQLIEDGELTRDVQVAGFLIVEEGPAILRHAGDDGRDTGEHAAIRLPVGRYIIGRQAEGDEEQRRAVMD